MRNCRLFVRVLGEPFLADSPVPGTMDLVRFIELMIWFVLLKTIFQQADWSMVD